MRPSYEETLAALCETDPRVVVMTAESRSAIRGLPTRLGPRFIDVGISEQAMLGMAAGLALRGRVPVCHALAPFLTLRAYEFIRTDLGIAGLSAILVGSVPGFLSGANGPTHQSLDDLAVMRPIPGMRVVWPADVEELCACMPELVATPGLAYVRYNTSEPRVAHRPFELGVAEELRSGDGIALVTAGLLVGEALDAATLLEARGHSIRVVNLRSLAPIDSDAIVRAARACRLVVTLEDHFLAGGLFTIVAETLVTQRVSTRVVPIGLDRRWFEPVPFPCVLACEGFDGPGIAARVLAALEPEGGPCRD
ncbi:MAG: transketolase [Deltaproteobacteria bacterium]|nr:transketolase [Deltaproteobacteria bacterium]